MFGFLAAIPLIGKCIKETCEPTLPAEYHGNWRLEEHDSQLVREGKMTQRQFEKNMNNGKYYAAPKQSNSLDPAWLRHYYGGRWRGTLNMNCQWGNNGEYDFIKNMSQEEAKSEYLKIPYTPLR